MSCKCGSSRIVSVSGKTSDCFFAKLGDREHEGYVPSTLGVGCGDYVEFRYCADCGTIQGQAFPLPDDPFER